MDYLGGGGATEHTPVYGGTSQFHKHPWCNTFLLGEILKRLYIENKKFYILLSANGKQ